MQLFPYLHFRGNCEEALTFYAGALHGQIDGLQRFAGSPMEARVGDAHKNKVMHAAFVAGELRFMASDGLPGADRPVSDSNISLSLSTPDGAEAQRVFDALSEGGTVDMPLQSVFWGGRFGMLTDRFGVDWMMSTDG